MTDSKDAGAGMPAEAPSPPERSGQGYATAKGCLTLLLLTTIVIGGLLATVILFGDPG